MVKSWDMCIKGFNRWRSCALLPGNDVSPSISSPLCLSFGFFDRGGPNVNLIWSDVWQRRVSEWEWGSWFWAVCVCVCVSVHGRCDGKLGLLSKGGEGWVDGDGGARRRGEGLMGGKTGGCVCREGSDRVCEVSQWGEQLDWGTATLPTLSSLSRINETVLPARIHERTGLPHTLPPIHTLSVSDLHRHDRPPPCHIYPQQCRGEWRLLLVTNRRATSE